MLTDDCNVSMDSKATSSEEINVFCIMPRYGKNLDTYFEQRKYEVSKESIFNLGMQLLGIMEQIHKSGYIYNDLKPDNILLQYGKRLPKDCSSGNCFQDLTLVLVDFGFATRYIDKKTGEHLEEAKLNFFRGNQLFASKYHLDFDRTSRRDDITSIFFLMVYMLNGGKMPGVDNKKCSKLNSFKKHQLLLDLK